MKRRAFTLIEIMIVILLISILLMIAVPQFMTARENGQETACYENQSQLDDAKILWKMGSAASSGLVPTMGDLVPENIKQTPVCPTGGTYTLGDEETLVTCSNHPRPTTEKSKGKGKGKDKGKGKGKGKG